MDKERELYNKFLDTLNNYLDDECDPKILGIILKFLENNHIEALPSNKKLSSLTSKISSLPFDDEELLPKWKS